MDKCENYKQIKVDAHAIYWEIFESKLSTKRFASFFRDFFEWVLYNLWSWKIFNSKKSLKKEAKHLVERVN